MAKVETVLLEDRFRHRALEVIKECLRNRRTHSSPRTVNRVAIPNSEFSGEGLLMPGLWHPAVESAPVSVEKRQAQD